MQRASSRLAIECKKVTMRVVAFVPLKLINRRLPGKNTKLFGGVAPLYHFILNSLLDIKSLDSIYVFCSEKKLGDLPSGVRYIQRDKDLDKDSTSIVEVAQDFAKKVPADIYLMAHATAPFLSSESMDKLIRAVVEPQQDSATTVTGMKDFLWDESGPLNYSLDFVPRTQDLKEIFVETTGAYAFTRELIFSSRRLGSKPELVKVSKLEAVDINSLEDWIIGDALMKNLDPSRKQGTEQFSIPSWHNR